VVKAFATGTVVQVFLLARSVPADAGGDGRPGGQSHVQARVVSAAELDTGRDGRPGDQS
jgi:hypothetical protein